MGKGTSSREEAYRIQPDSARDVYVDPLVWEQGHPPDADDESKGSSP